MGKSLNHQVSLRLASKPYPSIRCCFTSLLALLPVITNYYSGLPPILDPGGERMSVVAKQSRRLDREGFMFLHSCFSCF